MLASFDGQIAELRSKLAAAAAEKPEVSDKPPQSAGTAMGGLAAFQQQLEDMQSKGLLPAEAEPWVQNLASLKLFVETMSPKPAATAAAAAEGPKQPPGEQPAAGGGQDGAAKPGDPPVGDRAAGSQSAAPPGGPMDVDDGMPSEEYWDGIFPGDGSDAEALQQWKQKAKKAWKDEQVAKRRKQL